MRAMVVKRYGPPEVFESREVPDPQPKPGEVVIRVKAVGVNFADLLQRMGIYPGTPKPPFVPGFEVSGVVEKIAEGGKAGDGEPLHIGDAVAALTMFNAYAEWVAVPAGRVYRLPAGMPFDDAAAIPVNYLTAYHSMFAMGNLQSGDRILIHGAAGGVGIAAVQIARAMGMTVIGTAGTDKGLELVRREGVHHAFNHKNAGYTDAILKATNGRGVDVVLEMLANVNLAADLKLLARFGRVIIIGSRGDISITPRDLMARRGTIRGFTLWAATETETVEIHAAIAAGLENDTLRPIVGKELPLKDAAVAHQEILSPGAFGKIALVA